MSISTIAAGMIIAGVAAMLGILDKEQETKKKEFENFE